MASSDIIDAAIHGLEQIRSDQPKVHVLTNFVAMNFSANAMLAIGATPSMTIDETVIEEFIQTAKALVVNLGQVDPWRKVSVPLAIAAANKFEIPWLLDPVKVDRAGKRLSFASMLIDQGPAVVRCNSNEVGVLDGLEDLVLAVTGEVDHITEGRRRVDIANGSPLMDRVTAMGCALSAVTGCFLAVEPDRFLATAGSVLCFDIAGDIAAERARGPGSFQVEFLDALHALDSGAIRSRARIS